MTSGNLFARLTQPGEYDVPFFSKELPTMTKATINATALVLLPLCLTACGGVDEQAACLSEASPGLLYGRIIESLGSEQ